MKSSYRNRQESSEGQEAVGPQKTAGGWEGEEKEVVVVVVVDERDRDRGRQAEIARDHPDPHE